VAATTTAGRPAVDLPGAVAIALEEQGVGELDDLGACTACEPGWFSHRATGEAARQAAIAWIEA
jgi:copper oxidase (laccase) domain-containing protein